MVVVVWRKNILNTTTIEKLIGSENGWSIFDDTYTNYDESNNESFALNSEIHDVRIYDVSLDEDFATDIANFGLKLMTI